jgi:pimeloyl-ACP methyl ester carboxylesterase
LIKKTKNPQTGRRSIAVATLAVASAVLCLLPGLGAGTLPTAQARVPHAQKATTGKTPDKTSAKEAKRVDSVPTPKLKWYSCNDYEGAQCATVKLPLDYDKPKGAKVELALLKVPAKDQKHKIGSVFVNPGGPGGSAVDFASGAKYLFPKSITNKFDVVGVDPRGIVYSDRLQCFPDARRQQPVLTELDDGYPLTTQEIKAYQKGSKELGEACSDYGAKMAGAMSTAEDARDMDVLRRAVGDKKLTYLGFSYGTYLGQVYANLFPDRVRSMVIDGVLDPTAWAGTKATRNTPQTIRLESAQGDWRAMKELMRRCDEVGPKKCSFAPTTAQAKTWKTTRAKFTALATDVLAKPVTVKDPENGDWEVDYSTMIEYLLQDLYSADNFYLTDVMDTLNQIWAFSRLASKTLASDAAHPKADVLEQHRTRLTTRSGTSYGFPYNNDTEAFTGVLCTDSMNPSKVSDWPPAIDKLKGGDQYFGALWAWESTPCASSTWTATDEDAYHGPFDKTTSGPVLVVGDYWDPATNYQGAVKAASLLGNSRLLLSDSWGHTAYGTSACATQAVVNALASVKMPAKGTRCVGDAQPYTGATTPKTAQRTTKAATGVDPKQVDQALRSGRQPGSF